MHEDRKIISWQASISGLLLRSRFPRRYVGADDMISVLKTGHWPFRITVSGIRARRDQFFFQKGETHEKEVMNQTALDAYWRRSLASAMGQPPRTLFTAVSDMA